jgi:XTP/dITP diphosphohydrolase
MNKIVLATTNKGKIKELQSLLSSLNLQIISIDDLDKTLEVIEDQDTFAGNALKKATAYMKYTGLPAIADDSGLCVDYLNGEPGVYSARFAGENSTDQDNNNKLLILLDDVPVNSRTAHFTSAIALVMPNGEKHVVEGECKGIITRESVGDNGFGYDPLFFVPEANKTFAQMDDDQKNKVSHRGKAFTKLYDLMSTIWQ